MTTRKEPVRVSDHAVLRYMERAKGFDVASVREHIATLCAGPAALGASCVRAEGVKFELGDNSVITVVPDHVTPGKTTRERNQHRLRLIKSGVRGVSP